MIKSIHNVAVIAPTNFTKHQFATWEFVNGILGEHYYLIREIKDVKNNYTRRVIIGHPNDELITEVLTRIL